MKCDQVFELLTRAPFPQGADSDMEVEEHILGCHDCRQLAEALRPATELFHEAMLENESSDLPSYRGQLASQTEHRVGTALLAPWLADETVASDPQVHSEHAAQIVHKPTNRTRSGRIWGWGLGLGLTCLTLGMALTWATLPLNESQPQGRIHLANLQLPIACSSPRDQLAQAPIGVESVKGFFCCSQCHASAIDKEKRPPVTAIAVVMSTCTSCHSSDMPN